MKPVLKAVTATFLTLGLILAAAPTATANDTSTVDYAEFAEVKLGHTPAQVATIFDSAGVTAYADSQQLEKHYRVAYGDKRLDVGVSYYKMNGAWKATQKWVFWTWEPNPAHDPATKAEFVAVRQGMTVAQVRAIIGSQGTRSGDHTVQTSAYGFFPVKYRVWREYTWPAVGGRQGDAVIQFEQKNGVFVVSGKFGVVWP